ncbi:MAG: DUF1684 domain-containing protein [Xanthomonadales bacterium]
MKYLKQYLGGYFAGLVFLLLVLLSVTGFAGEIASPARGPDAESHRELIQQWRQKRNARLASDFGWLSLVGLEWLQEGENRVGSGQGNTIRLSGGPDYWGSVFLEENKLRFVRADLDSVTVDDEYANEVLMVPDTEGTPTIVQSGTIRFYPIFRESYALRVKDSQAPVRVNFKGTRNFDIQRDWRIDGRFIRGEKGETIEIGNVLGQLIPSPVYGRFEFERDGKTFRMIAIADEDSESLEFMFADRSNGHSTYAAGRFVYSDGMPENGRLVVDFNKTYNPPCAFNDYSTCPLPVQENRLNLDVTAGEKDFH